MSFKLQPLFLTFLGSGSGGNFFGPLSPLWPWIELWRWMKELSKVNFQDGV